MPELFRFFGMKFFCYSLEHLPMHVHVMNGDGTAKFEVDPIKLIESRGMKVKDLALAEALIEEKRDEIIKRWKEIHG